jgi:general secretion pathway protein D
MVSQEGVVSVGDRVTLRIEIQGADDVGSVPFHVVFDPAVLRFEAGREGTFMNRGGRQTAFFAAPMSNGSDVAVGLSRLGRGDGIEGSGELCTLTFTVLGPGDASLAFVRAQVRDAQNRIVPADFQPTVLIAD